MLRPLRPESNDSALDSANIRYPNSHTSTAREQPPSDLPVKLDRSEARRSLTGKDTIAARAVGLPGA
jgi:hypothetical protein